MIEGVLRHCTEMAVEKSYVDSHGQSEVAFAFCHLLGFELLPRLKGLARQKLYRPEAEGPGDYPAPAARPHAAHRLGPDPPAVRRDGQVRHGPAARDGRRRRRSSAGSRAGTSSTRRIRRWPSWARRSRRASCAGICTPRRCVARCMRR